MNIACLCSKSKIPKKARKSFGMRFLRMSFAFIASLLWRLIARPKRPRMPPMSQKLHIHPLVKPALRELQGKKSISDRTIKMLANSLSLKDTHLCEIFTHQKVSYSNTSLLSKLPNPNLCKERFIAIPLALKSMRICRHWVLIIIDLRQDTIEFYDSLGLALADYSKALLWTPKLGANLSLQSLVQILLETYGTPSTKFLENTKTHQKDATNCALFMLDRLHKRISQNLCFGKAQKNPLSSKEAFSTKREHFMKMLLNRK